MLFLFIDCESVNVGDRISMLGENIYESCSSFKIVVFRTGAESVSASAFEGV